MLELEINMMYEIANQTDGRWFCDDYFDLFVLEKHLQIVRFTLYY